MRYFGALLRYAWRPTAKVAKDLRAETGLIAVALAYAYFFRPHGNHGTALHQIAVGLGWTAAAVAGLLALVFLFNLALAPPHLYFESQDKWSRKLSEVQRRLEQFEYTAKAEAEIAEGRMRTAAQLLGTELRDIRHQIEIVNATHARQYRHGFELPAARFDEYDELLAIDPGLYETVERAYVAAHHVNLCVRTRLSRGLGVGGALGAIDEDGLDAAYEAAGAALVALGERIDRPFVLGAEAEIQG